MLELELRLGAEAHSHGAAGSRAPFPTVGVDLRFATSLPDVFSRLSLEMEGKGERNVLLMLRWRASPGEP